MGLTTGKSNDYTDVGFIDPKTATLAEINAWFKTMSAKLVSSKAINTSSSGANQGWGLAEIGNGIISGTAQPGDEALSYFGRLANNPGVLSKGWNNMSEAYKRQLITNFGNYAIEQENKDDGSVLSKLQGPDSGIGKLLWGAAALAVGAGLGSEFTAAPLSGPGLSPGINIGGNIVGNTAGGAGTVASGGGYVGGSGTVLGGGSPGGGTGGGNLPGGMEGGGNVNLPGTTVSLPGGGGAGSMDDIISGGGGNTVLTEGDISNDNTLNNDNIIKTVVNNITNAAEGWSVDDVINLLTSAPVVDLLQGVFRGLGADEITDKYDDLIGDLEADKMPTWFYDQARGFASIGSDQAVGGTTGIPDLDADNDGLPDRYNSVLDYITQASERQGAAKLGGTSDHAGATADIMADAVSRTYATMWNQDLNSLLNGANIETDYNANINNTLGQIFEGWAGAMGDKYAAYGQIGGGALNWLNDYANS